MRQIVLDTETTGLVPAQGHRIIEIGCVELVNRRHTGRHFHQYVNPGRDIEADAQAVHGISRERLETAPPFAAIAGALLEFIRGSELVIHNAEFDVAFLDLELARLTGGAPPGATPAAAPDAPPGAPPGIAATQGACASGVIAAWPASVRAICGVLDTLTLARQRHPGQRNNLDALCKRYAIDNSHRDLHGALLDAQLLADVYLAMTGGQSLLALEDGAREGATSTLALGADADGHDVRSLLPPGGTLRVLEPSQDELAAHAELTALLAKASGGRCLWLQEQAA
jgi:DNA polymerase III subunit epsilon